METLIVDHPSVVEQQLHDDLQMLSRIDICRHDIVVRTVKQDFPQELDGLPLRNIALRLDENRVVLCEERVKVGL